MREQLDETQFNRISQIAPSRSTVREVRGNGYFCRRNLAKHIADVSLSGKHSRE